MIGDALRVFDPPWARETNGPEWAPMLAGVLYHQVPVTSALSYVREAEVLATWAAVGRRLFADRLGPWLTWSDQRYDRQRSCVVAQREWPWNLGDEVVFLVRGSAGLTMVDVELDDDDQSRMFTAVGTSLAAQDTQLFVREVEQWVRQEIGPKARRLEVRAEVETPTTPRIPWPLPPV